jgi:integrase
MNTLLLKIVRSVLDLAFEREYIPKNPHGWFESQHEEEPDIDPLSFDEMRGLLAALPERKWVHFYTVAFGTGLRPSEQFALQWHHVDFKRKILLIRQGFVNGRLTLLKTRGSKRDVDMLPSVQKALEKHREETQGKGLYVFSNLEGGPLHRDNIRNRIWNPALAWAGLRHRNPYQTRHTFASLMLQQGEDPAWVARMLGYTTTRMLYERYARFIRNRKMQDGKTGSGLKMNSTRRGRGKMEKTVLRPSLEIGRGYANRRYPLIFLERDTGLEPATFALARRRSTN